jgi:hypothetical protein
MQKNAKIKVSLLISLMYESNYTLRKHCPILPTKKCILHQSPFPVYNKKQSTHHDISVYYIFLLYLMNMNLINIKFSDKK